MLILFTLIFCFAFCFHFLWEMWQITFYSAMPSEPHIEVVWFCTKATFGDAIMAVVAYGFAGFLIGNIRWLMQPNILSVVLYIIAGLSMTMVFEYLAVEVWHRWSYSDAMIRLPILGTGLSPLIQWLIVPLLTLYVSHVFLIGLQLKADKVTPQ